jgi:protein-disulfide isomerase
MTDTLFWFNIATIQKTSTNERHYSMTTKLKRKNQQNQTYIIGGIIAAAIAVAAVAIFVSSSGLNPSAIDIDYSRIHQERTDDGGFILGNPEAPVTIVAFEDFLCPHCQDYESTLKRFIQEYVIPGKARFEYRFTPAIDPRYSVEAAQFVECAEIIKPGSFWDAHDIMFELAASERYSSTTPRKFAERTGLNYAQLLECQPEADQIKTDMTLGDSLGVSGTPTVFVRYGDGAPERLPQPPSFDQFASIIAGGQ